MTMPARERKKQFEMWMMTLDDLVQTHVGVSVHDLPDQSFADWFEDGLTAQDAFRLMRMEGAFS